MSRERRMINLIHGLAADLQPVRRLPPPLLRALTWLALLAALAIGLAAFADLDAVWQRISAAPDLWLAVIGSTLTAILAAIAAFELSMPDAPRAWAALPLPAAILWVGASGFGCLRVWVAPQSHVAVMGEARDCLIFIVALVGAALGAAAHDAAARVSALSRPYGCDRRPRGRGCGRHAAELLSSLRCGGDRSCRSCGGRRAGDCGQSRARRTNFRGSGLRRDRCNRGPSSERIRRRWRRKAPRTSLRRITQ